jgi:tRNA 5-methylaminomethyl-2-thiouridine biosynthesis bifunctional protein
MQTPLQNAKLSWNEAGNPVSDSFDDIYFCNENGLNETHFVFLQGNKLPNRWKIHDRDIFVVAETGFGTGLNFLATWQAFLDYRKNTAEGKTKRLHFISFEMRPLSINDLKKALNLWPELSHLSEQLITHYPYAVTGCHRLRFDKGSVVLDLWLGDINHMIPQVYCQDEGIVDAWFLDGFAPSKNPEMWSEHLFLHLHRLTRYSGTLSTFTAAGSVRRGLAAAGFLMEKSAGHGTKKHMLIGCCNKNPSPVVSLKKKQITVIGGGIASACLTYLLTQRGYHVSLFCADEAVAQGASGNPQGAIYPLLHHPDILLSQFFVAAFHFCQQLVNETNVQTPFPHDWSGVTFKAFDEKTSLKNRELVAAAFPPELLQTAGDDVVLPTGGWISPVAFIDALFQLSNQSGRLTTNKQCEIISINQHQDRWQLHDAHNNEWFASHVVIANGANATVFEQTALLPITPMRGQISQFPAKLNMREIEQVVCGDGYIIPAINEQYVIGATYVRNENANDVRESEHNDNIKKLQRTLNLTAQEVANIQITGGRAAIRGVTRDHFPLVGGFRDVTMITQTCQTMSAQGWLPAIDPSFSVLTGFGSRGLCSAPFSAEILAALLLDEPLPCSLLTLQNIDPQRRQLKHEWRQKRYRWRD